MRHGANFDLEQRPLQALDNPFGTRLSLMSQVRGVTHVSGTDRSRLAERAVTNPSPVPCL